MNCRLTFIFSPLTIFILKRQPKWIWLVIRIRIHNRNLLFQLIFAPIFYRFSIFSHRMLIMISPVYLSVKYFSTKIFIEYLHSLWKKAWASYEVLIYPTSGYDCYLWRNQSKFSYDPRSLPSNLSRSQVSLSSLFSKGEWQIKRNWESQNHVQMIKLKKRSRDDWKSLPLPVFARYRMNMVWVKLKFCKFYTVTNTTRYTSISIRDYIAWLLWIVQVCQWALHRPRNNPEFVSAILFINVYKSWKCQ